MSYGYDQLNLSNEKYSLSHLIRGGSFSLGFKSWWDTGWNNATPLIRMMGWQATKTRMRVFLLILLKVISDGGVWQSPDLSLQARHIVRFIIVRLFTKAQLNVILRYFLDLYLKLTLNNELLNQVYFFVYLSKYS